MKNPADAHESVVQDSNTHPSEDLALWLQEAAKRPWSDGPPSVSPPVLSVAVLKTRQAPHGHSNAANRRDLVALAALSVGFLQYYYLDVMVQIGNLTSVVVFVPLAVA